MVACDLGFWDKEARVGTDQRASRRRRAGRSLPLCLREITMLERLPHKMIFVVCPRVRD